MSPAELRARARRLDAAALAAEDNGDALLAASRRARARLDRRGAAAAELRTLGDARRVEARS